jgi:hypothetical protein
MNTLHAGEELLGNLFLLQHRNTLRHEGGCLSGNRGHISCWGDVNVKALSSFWANVSFFYGYKSISFFFIFMRFLSLLKKYKYIAIGVGFIAMKLVKKI